MTRRSRTLFLMGIAFLLLFGSVWILFAPRAVGGHASYVGTHGISMEPVFHTGDLVVVRQQSQYRSGEVVAYQSHLLNVTVLHRIIGRDGNRFVTKGDNNSFVDADHPLPSDIFGAEWMLIARGGTAVGWLRQPAHAVPVAVGLALVVGGGFGANSSRRRRGRNGTRHPRPPKGSAIAFGAWQVSIAALTATLLCLSLTWIAFHRPSTTAKTVTYVQQGQFTYGAPVAVGPVYQRPTLATGDPIFLRLVPRLAVTFDYTFQAPGAHKVGGTVAIGVELAGANGWTRTLPEGPATTFRGDQATAGTSLDFVQLRSMITEAEKATGIVGGSYTVRIKPDLRVAGSLSGKALADAFSSPLSFNLTADQLLLAQGSTLRASKSATVTVPGATPHHLVFEGRNIDVALLRWASTIGAGFFLLTALFAALAATRKRPDRRERGRIYARYHRSLVPVTSLDGAVPIHVIEVPNFEALMRIATHYERLVLVRRDDERADTYAVEDGGVQFRYRSGRRRPQPEAAAGTPAGAAGKRWFPKDFGTRVPPKGVDYLPRHALVPSGADEGPALPLP